jgi:hypothetical protein
MATHTPRWMACWEQEESEHGTAYGSDGSAACDHVHTRQSGVGRDWQACTNPMFPRAGLLTCAPMGCESDASSSRQRGQRHVDQCKDRVRHSRPRR